MKSRWLSIICSCINLDSLSNHGLEFNILSKRYSASIRFMHRDSQYIILITRLDRIVISTSGESSCLTYFPSNHVVFVYAINILLFFVEAALLFMAQFLITTRICLLFCYAVMKINFGHIILRTVSDIKMPFGG